MASVVFNRLDLVLKFVFPKDDGSGKMEEKKVTLTGIRHGITPDEIVQVGDAFATLSSHDYIGVERVQRDRVDS